MLILQQVTYLYFYQENQWKKANMTLGFKNNHTVIFDKSIWLLVTKSGHYAIPTNAYKTILKNVTSGVNTKATLVSTKNNK